MNWLIYLGAGVELVQLALIALLVFKYRRLQRRLDEDLRFTRRPPQSITEESLFHQPSSTLIDPTPDESKFEAVRRA
jgi:hypothetical protein